MSAQSTFAYRARDASGQVVTGSLVAGSAREVGSRLRAEGKFVLAVDENALRADTQLDAEQVRRSEAVRRVRREDVIAFCQQLAVMLETGVPLSEAMDAFCQQSARRDFRIVLEAIRNDVYAGEPFSTAMSRWPRAFPTLMVSLMKASEASGTMAMMLGRMADYLSKERKTARQIKGALTYPAFMMGIAFALTAFLMVFILPRFASIYTMRSAALPTPTRVLLGISEFVMTQYLVYGPVALVVGLGLYFWLRTDHGRRRADWLRLFSPVLGSMYRNLYLTRAARTMSTLLGAGVGLLDIIEICRGVTNNKYYDDLWSEVSDNIREGKQLSEAISESQFIPANVSAMIAAGERSGRLVDVMARVAEFSEDELDSAVKQATACIEPTMIVTMGLLVGGVAMALLLPIFQMSSVMSGG